jgi:hypothetical protein
MTTADISAVHQFVDLTLDKWRLNGLMQVPFPTMPVEMRDETRVVKRDWLPWKPIPSTVTEHDMHEVEGQIKLRYPDLYKELLCYKHFYDLSCEQEEQEISFFRHGIYEWKDRLLRAYFNSWEPSKLIGQGYLYFADYEDWGIICFDTNNQRPEDNDCPIVLIDHELLYDEPLPLKILYPSFANMIRSLLTEQQKPSQPEEQL